MEAPSLTEEQFAEIYAWIDDIPLTKPKKNISRDFSDGSMMAEVMAHFIPRIVEVHNYVPTHASLQKINNWNMLNRTLLSFCNLSLISMLEKVFRKLGFQVSRPDVDAIIQATPGAIERVLLIVKIKIDEFKAGRKGGGETESETISELKSPIKTGDTGDGLPRIEENRYGAKSFVQQQSGPRRSPQRVVVPPGNAMEGLPLKNNGDGRQSMKNSVVQRRGSDGLDNSPKRSPPISNKSDQQSLLELRGIMQVIVLYSY